MKGTITMSTKEANRIAILEKLVKKELKQHQAATLLRLSVRQVRRLMKRYKKEGAEGIIHRLRGIPSNRRFDETIIDQAVATIKQRYHDFGPTLAHEKLVILHGVTFSRETLRKGMVCDGMWQPKRQKTFAVHPLRERRSHEGELVQVDGSPHTWFEDRGPLCTLLVYIDDATGKLLHLELVESETMTAYFLATKHYLLRHGKPLAFYVDKHGVFRVNTRRAATASVDDDNGVTQFGRAMQELAIELIFANGAEAKGRVERVNQTLQDRLVKELRLKSIATIKEGNNFLPEFMSAFNRRFAVAPKYPGTAHRPLLSPDNLDEILCQKHIRTLSKQLTLSYQNKRYQIHTERPLYAMRHARVTVREDLTGKITIEYHGKQLAYTTITEQPKATIADSKQLNLVVDTISQSIGIPMAVVNHPYTPPPSHPWRRARRLEIELAQARHEKEHLVLDGDNRGTKNYHVMANS